MSWISIAIEALDYAATHRKEIAHGAETAIHFLRRVERQLVDHSTTADKLLGASEKVLHEYNEEEEKKDSN